MALNPEWISAVAGTLTTLAYVPQAVKTLRTRDTSSLSLGMYVAIVTGLALWAIYGWMIGSMALLLANLITFMLAATILVMKLRCG